MNHTYYRCMRTAVYAANREGIIKQLSVEHMSMFCSRWLLLSWVIALLTALVEGEVGITQTYKAKHIFNSSATPRFKTLTQTSLWNLIHLRPRPAIGSHKCARFCRQQIHGEIQLLRALTAPHWPHRNLGTKTVFMPMNNKYFSSTWGSQSEILRALLVWENTCNKQAGPPFV